MPLLLAYISGASNRSDTYLNLLPSGLCYLHATLREAGYDARLANFSAWSTDAIERYLAGNPPRIAGISQWTHNRHHSLELARLIRKTAPACTIIMGGAHATFQYSEVLEEGDADIVVLGEGEVTMRELAACLSNGRETSQVPGIAFRTANGVIRTTPRKPLDDLDLLPLPARYLTSNSIGIDTQLQAEFIVTARGCPYSCHFCSSPAFWGRTVRFRSATAIVEEMLYIRDTFGLLYFSLRDDTFTADRRRAMDFCRIMHDKKAGLLWNCQSNVRSLDFELLIAMKRAGCECVQLGIESGSPTVLGKLGKSITPVQITTVADMVRKVGINLSIYLISDIPDESDEDITLTRELVRRIRPDDGYVSPLAYYPGTRLYQDALQTGQTSSDLFRRSQESALYALPTRIGTNRLMKVFGSLPAPDPRRFAQQKHLLGFCHTTNILAGTWYEQTGQLEKAAAEYQEILDHEPQNPWGWYLRGEVWNCLGNPDGARECYRRVLELVPWHAPSREALGMKKAGP